MEFEVVCVDRGIFPGGRGSKIIRFGIRHGTGVDLIDKDALLFRMGKGDRFFVQSPGHKVYLHEALSAQGHTFVETAGDDTLMDNLAALPGCARITRSRSERENPIPTTSTQGRMSVRTQKDRTAMSIRAILQIRRHTKAG